METHKYANICIRERYATRKNGFSNDFLLFTTKYDSLELVLPSIDYRKSLFFEYILFLYLRQSR